MCDFQSCERRTGGHRQRDQKQDKRGREQEPDQWSRINEAIAVAATASEAMEDERRRASTQEAG